MININIKSKSIFAVTVILALFLCISMVSATDLSTDIETSHSNDVKVVKNNNVVGSGDSANIQGNDRPLDEDDTSFTALNQTIHSGNDTIVLDHDYKFNDATDAAFRELGGIVVHRSITIDGQNHKIDCDNQVRFLISLGNNITLKNIQIENGYVSSNSSIHGHMCGGAVVVVGGDAFMTNVDFRDCNAYNRGGAVAIVDGNGVFTGCQFHANKASYGGAVDVMNGNAVFNEGCSFDHNVALDYGGAVRVSNGWATFDLANFLENMCNETGIGGALYFSNGANATITNSVFEGNKAKRGGAIFIQSPNGEATLEIINGNFTDNFGEAVGGAIVVSNVKSNFTLANFENNSGNYEGGAVAVESSDAIFDSCTFVNNCLTNDCPFHNTTSTSQKLGGAIYISATNNNLSVNNCTFTNNSANLTRDSYGGAIALLSGNLSVSNSNFSDNTVGNIIITNGAVDDKGGNTVPTGEELSQYFATMALNVTNWTYGIQNGLLGFNITCMNPEIIINGTVNVYHNGKLVASARTTDGIGWIPLQYIPIGDHNLQVTFTGTPRFVYLTQNIPVNVSKPDSSNITYQYYNITYGDGLTVTVKLGDDFLKYGTIYCVLGSQVFVGNITNGSITVPGIIPAGKYDGFLFLDPDNFNTKIEHFNVTVDKRDVELNATVSPASLVYGQPIQVHIHTDYAVNGLAFIKLGSSTFRTILENGDGVINMTGVNAGLHTFRVQLHDPSYNVDTSDLTINVTKTTTKIDISPATYVINYGGTYTIDVANVTNGAVTVTIAGKSIGTFTTDAQGHAKITITAAQLKAAGAGSKQIVVKYAGDNNHEMSTSANVLTINKEATKFANVKTAASSYKSTAKSMKLTATLKDSKNKVMKNQVVTFKVNNRKSFSVKTNAKGVATLTLNAAKIKQCKLNKKGNYKFTVTYKTTPTYNQATATGKIKVSK